MKLWLKVLVILASVWAIIFCIIYVYSRYTLINDYVLLEKHEMVNDISQTRKTFSAMMANLTVLTNDWSQWDDAYQFMADKNNSFIKKNMSFTTFENANINLILFFDTSGKLFYGQQFDLEQKKFIPISQSILDYLELNTNFLSHTDVNSKKAGIASIDNNYLVLSSLPVLTSEAKGPIRGTLVMAYFFTRQQIEKLSDIVNKRVEFFTLPLKQNDALANRAYKDLSSGKPYYIKPSDDQIFGFTFINNIDNKPIGILSVSFPRKIYEQGIITIDRYLAIVISLGIIFLFSTWFLLKKFVLDPIVDVNNQLTDISQGSKFSKRIKGTGHNEIGMMIHTINSLMEIIELSQEQLKYRIFLRTEELERLSNLNKNLFGEMSHQKEIETQLREGEKVLRRMAYYDSLTGLPNRLFFEEMVKKNVAKSAREGASLAILFIDSDGLKTINDSYGHSMGDKYLKHAAQQLKNSIKENDVAARLAGDEFIVCLTNIGEKDVLVRVIDKILNNISKPLIIGNVEIKSTFSMGVSIYPDDGTTLEELEEHADLAMYYAKKHLGNAFCFFEDIAKDAYQNSEETKL